MTDSPVGLERGCVAGGVPRYIYCGQIIRGITYQTEKLELDTEGHRYVATAIAMSIC